MSKFRIHILGLFMTLIPFDNIKIVPFSMSSVLGVAYILSCLDGSIRFRKKWLVELLPFILSFLVITCASFFYLDNPGVRKGEESLFNSIVLYIIVAIILVITVAQEENIRHYRTMLWYLFFTVGFASATGLYEFYMVFFHGVFPFGDRYIQYFPPLEIYTLRITGCYFDPNYFSVLPMIAIACASQLIRNKTLEIVINVLLVILVLSTFSRMALICLSLYYAVRFVSPRFFMYIALPALLVFSPVVLIWLTELRDFFVDINPNSTDDRMEILTGGIDMIIANPIFGYGFSTRSPINLEAHNTFLQLMLYGGIIGFASIVLPIVICLYKVVTFKPVTAGQQELRTFLLSLSTMFILAMVFLSFVMSKFFWVYLITLFLGKNRLYGLPDEDERPEDARMPSFTPA